MAQYLVASDDTERIRNRLTAQTSEGRKEIDARLTPVKINSHASSRIHGSSTWVIISQLYCDRRFSVYRSFQQVETRGVIPFELSCCTLVNG